MITLSILGVLYTIFGFIRFKKLYGHYRLVDEQMQVWTLLLAVVFTLLCVACVILCIHYLP
jgi:hypothetical protein